MGLVVDVLLDPIQLLGNPAQEASLAAGEGVHDRAALLDVEGVISITSGGVVDCRACGNSLSGLGKDCRLMKSRS